MRTLLPLLLLATAAQAQFELQQSHTTASLRGIHALSARVAWASGTNGTVLRTSDGGTLWQTCPTPPGAEKLDFRGVQAFDASTAIVMSSGKGDLSRLYKTTDACQTWTLLYTNLEPDGFWDAVTAPTQLKIRILGDPVHGRFPIQSSNDGGKTWLVELSQPAAEGEAAFAASNSAMLFTDPPSNNDAHVLFWGSGGIAAPNIWGYDISKSVNCGDHCQKVTLAPFPATGFSGSHTSGVFSLAYDGYDGVMAVGGDYTKPDQPGSAAFRSLRGYGWQPAIQPPHGYRSSVAYDAPSKTWITVGPNGTDVSRDDGKNWTALHPTPLDTPDADQHWNALSLPFAVGPKGRIGKVRADALKK